ncbi:hypothetical protein IJ135_01640 [Candidatus Saccharibacteria bacterium]|nr:hypothetical protein [Candidatus Saccharibacteria bacterium]
MKSFKYIKRAAVAIVAAAVLAVQGALMVPAVMAEGSGATSSFSMSPMMEKVVLDPGEEYQSSFSIHTPSNMTTPFNYKVYVQSYFRDENNNAIFENVDGMSQIVDWITIDTGDKGTLEPGGSAKIAFTINVPKNAPAGGQYAAITVGSDTSAGDDNTGSAIMIQESVAMAYTVYAEISGNTIRQGDIEDANVASFLFSGNIAGTSTIKNTGNVHGTATYKMQVFPIFSNEEIFTNEENPETRLIMPNRTVYNETTWDNTPWFGIFNVIYSVEFEGVTTEVSKMVIVCPIWALFIVIFAVVLVIFWLVARSRSRKKTGRLGGGKKGRTSEVKNSGHAMAEGAAAPRRDELEEKRATKIRVDGE